MVSTPRSIYTIMNGELCLRLRQGRLRLRHHLCCYGLRFCARMDSLRLRHPLGCQSPESPVEVAASQAAPLEHHG